ncbi:hypothetical protein TNCV_4138531 [Trichonephila clavipes]|nr:hypothetical protein TNCV_4138531 [Trichonephila clavipes]
MSKLKRPSVGLVWKLVEGCQLRCSPRHLTVAKITRPVVKGPRVAIRNKFGFRQQKRNLKFCDQNGGTKIHLRIK